MATLAEKKPEYVKNMLRIRDAVAEVLEKHQDFTESCRSGFHAGTIVQ